VQSEKMSKMWTDNDSWVGVAFDKNNSHHTGRLYMAVNVDNDKCIGCFICESLCPMNAIDIKDGKAHVSSSCVECGICLSECPREALSL